MEKYKDQKGGDKLKEIFESYKKLKTRDDYKHFTRNRKIAEGKTTEVFYPEIVKRVKLEHLGMINERDEIRSYVYSNGSLSSTSARFQDMIVGNNILQDISKVYSEKAADKEPIIKSNNDEWINKFDIADTVSELVFSSSYGGAILMKGVYSDDKFSYYAIKRNGFFEIYNPYNPQLIDGFVVFSQLEEEEDKLLLEIYHEGRTEYRAVSIKDDTWEEIAYPYELEGMKADGKGYINEYEGWQVGYIRAYSDYNNDLVSNVREIVIQDTTTSQSFSKCLSPILQVPESLIEYDNNGNGVVRVDDGIITVRKEDKDIKQIQLQTNVAEWNVQRKNIFDNIYKSTKTNENVFGLSANGSENASGTSKERSMESLISVVRNKRNKCYRALEAVLKWGYNQEMNGALEIVIEGTDVLEISEKEKLENQALEIQNLITLDKYLGDSEIQNALKDIKAELLGKFGIVK